MSLHKSPFAVIILAFIVFISSCDKYLDKKSRQNLSTPETLEDLQLILDNPDLNKAMIAVNAGSDEYFVDDAVFESLIDPEKSLHVWDAEADNQSDWNDLYRQVFNANTVLDNLNDIDRAGQETSWDRVKGTAFFIRAHAFFMLSQIFAPPYDPATATEELGIPLRLDPDFNKPSQRATLQQTYDQIFADLDTALPLLPDMPEFKNRPGKVAINALLARVYLSMEDYTNAAKFSEDALSLYDELMDYNLRDTSAPNAFEKFNPEVIFHTATDAVILWDPVSAHFDTSLYQLYSPDDLRKILFFMINEDGTIGFKATYEGQFAIFNGLATDEVYLTAAEAHVRLGENARAIELMTIFLTNRYMTGTAPAIDGMSADELLNFVLLERRKELVYRGTRWTDLRRLNKDPRFQITPKRILLGEEFTLPPNDPRYTVLIPRVVINMTGMPQNAR